MLNHLAAVAALGAAGGVGAAVGAVAGAGRFSQHRLDLVAAELAADVEEGVGGRVAHDGTSLLGGRLIRRGTLGDAKLAIR